MAKSLWTAADSDDAVLAASIIRDGNFIVFQQIDPDAENEENDEESFCVVLAEIDEDTAVVCFSNQDDAEGFAHELADQIPEGQDLPAIEIDGNSLLDGLPGECGLLVNAGGEHECYFPPGLLG